MHAQVSRALGDFQYKKSKDAEELLPPSKQMVGDIVGDIHDLL